MLAALAIAALAAGKDDEMAFCGAMLVAEAVDALRVMRQVVLALGQGSAK